MKRCSSAVVREPSTDDSGDLRAELRVRPRRELVCPLLEGDDAGIVAAHDLVCPDGSCKFGCECRAAVTTNDSSRIVGKEIEDDCVCPVFRNHACIASIEAFDSGELVVTLSLPSRELLPEIVEDLRNRGAAVELRSISRIASGGDLDRRELTIDSGAITDKQREAIEVAIVEGYYDSPRRADLEDLADRLGISRSAVSQRLTVAETTLVRALHEAVASGDDR